MYEFLIFENNELIVFVGVDYLDEIFSEKFLLIDDVENGRVDIFDMLYEFEIEVFIVIGGDIVMEGVVNEELF